MEDWRDVIYCVFDAPSHLGPFEERYRYLQTLHLPDHVRVLPQVKCQGPSHLNQFLESVISKEGEGIALRMPQSSYKNGTLYKYKPFQDIEVKYIKTHPASAGLVCLTANGKECVVRCPWTTFIDPPADTPVLTVTCHGFYNSGIPKAASFLRIRTDISWEEVLLQQAKESKLATNQMPS